MANTPVKDTEPTIGRLVSDASRDISGLISSEISLAKTELKVSVRAGGLSIAMFAAAAFVGVLAIIMLSISIAYFIHWNDRGLELHWAFLIVFGLYAVIAAVLGLIGVKKFRQVSPPQRAIDQGREIPKALKGRH